MNNTPTPSATTPDKAKQFHLREEWQRNFLRETLDQDKFEYLFHLLDLVKDQAESSNPIPSLNVLLSNWIDNSTINLNANENRIHLRNITTLITFLSELNIIYFCLNTETDFSKNAEVLEKEVDNE